MENKIILRQNQIDFLSNLPEQGMGYQIVDVTLKNGQLLKERIVLNSTYLKLDDSDQIKPDDIEKIELHKISTPPMNNIKNSEFRFKIIEKFAQWIAFSGTRSGCPLKSRSDVYPLINLPDYDKIFQGSKVIIKEEFNQWHEFSSMLITKKRPEMPIGWTTKLINLYLKEMVYVAQFGRPNLINCIHPPIDNGLWDGIKERYKYDKEIIAKTHSKNIIKDIVNYQDYRIIIDGIELIAKRENWPLIEVELLWKGTEFKNSKGITH